MKNIILKTTAVIMVLIAIASALLHAFHEPLLLYKLTFFFSYAWLITFAYANNWFKRCK